MQLIPTNLLRRAGAIAATLLICKVTVSVVLEYGRYFPPDFDADFLLGRQSYFWNGYHLAFYAHLVSGPASLLLGTLLISERIRQRAPLWHRRLGRLQALGVLLVVAPSGLWMAGYAMTGAAAGAGLGLLALLTAMFIALGWRAAVMTKFIDHRRWMMRTYILLCSAVVIRLIGGLATVAQFDALWLYPASCWLSWLVPLGIFESLQLVALREQSPHAAGIAVRRL